MNLQLIYEGKIASNHVKSKRQDDLVVTGT